jgi:ABC-type bacteriocin/lantibiotic exporter with double-glycine peptidase domain
MGLSGTLVALIGSFLSRDMVDIITGHSGQKLISTFILFVFFSVMSVAITQLTTYVSNMISIKVDNDIKADIFEKMLLTELEPLAAYHTGDLLTRWSSDASTVSSGVLNWIPNLIIYLIKFIASLAVVIYYDTEFAILALLGIPVSVILSRSLLAKMQSNNKESAAMSAKMSGFNQETFSNIQVIKAFDLIPLYVKNLKCLQKDYFNMKKKFQKLSTFTSIIMALAGIVVSYSCYALGIYRVWTGAISYGTMTLFLSLAGNLTSTLNSLIGMVPTAISITTSAGRLMDIIGMPKEDYSDRCAIKEFYERNKNDGFRIQLSNITYSYTNGTKVFEDASFYADSGEIVALIGRSGQGKTTMLRILLALLTPQNGEMFIAGIENSFDRVLFTPSVRQLYSYVPQGNTMFSGTIAENMRSVNPMASDDEIISCLKKACAWEFVSKMPMGINSPIGERGKGFSEGQSQRLSIARALLRDAPILLLDEATSALDTVTECEILKNIMTGDTARICIVTTHRPTVLSMCDRVYEISDRKCNVVRQ